jgi:DNA-3-methyladenine glycosylase
MKVLKPSFFNRPALDVAQDLIGCYLVRKSDHGTEHYMIIETEAYTGPEDLACHASGGRRTKRTEVLFGEPGHIYIYFTYGMHWLLNFVVGPKDFPAGVLIRGIISEDGIPIIGPARLTKKLGLNGSIHGKLANEETGLWVERGQKINHGKIKKLPRVGVDYAGPVWSKKKFRFLLQSDSVRNKYESP